PQPSRLRTRLQPGRCHRALHCSPVILSVGIDPSRRIHFEIDSSAVSARKTNVDQTFYLAGRFSLPALPPDAKSGESPGPFRIEPRGLYEQLRCHVVRSDVWRLTWARSPSHSQSRSEISSNRSSTGSNGSLIFMTAPSK